MDTFTNILHISLQGWSGSKDGKTVHADGRDGSHSLDKAYNGTNNNKFFRTPASFFTDDNGSGDKADTSSGITWVLNKTGDMHDVIASGTRILLPDIPGVGALRVRYPIMPTHAEGSATWKELDAASTPKDIQKDVLLLWRWRARSRNPAPKNKRRKRWRQIPCPLPPPYTTRRRWHERWPDELQRYCGNDKGSNRWPLPQTDNIQKQQWHLQILCMWWETNV